MRKLRIGIIGTGQKKARRDRFGFAMAYEHADAYQALEACEIVACADLVEKHARAFVDTYGVEQVFVDYQAMLVEMQLDMVSICTWPHLHEPMVLVACQAGVRAIHCEKPMWACSCRPPCR